MLVQILSMLLTAVLSSALTLGAAWWLWDRRLRRRLESRFAELREELGEELGETIRIKVRQGVLDAVAAIPSGELLRNTQRGITDTAVGIVRGGLSSLLGGPRTPRPGGDRDDEDGEE